MSDFLRFYDKVEHNMGWVLEIYHSSIVDWNIRLGYKITHSKHGETIFHIQDCDMELVFAKAQVALKEHLMENYDGY